MHLTMVTGVRNDEQTGDLERLRGSIRDTEAKTIL